MANKTLFSTRNARRNRLLKNAPIIDTQNDAGGKAYSYTSKQALAQFAVTGTFHGSYYANAQTQLDRVKDLANECDSEFLAKLAVYSREQGKMKDVPAYLLAVLAARNETEWFKRAFPRVCNNSKVLLGFAQIIRSGVTGRSSFGTSIKRQIQNWLTSKRPKSLYLASVGHSDPSLADLIKMVHPRPRSEEQSAMFSYLLGKECDFALLPPDIQAFEALKRGETHEIPDVPYRVLTNCELTKAQWECIALNAPWNTLRQSLLTFGRRGVFDDQAIVERLAETLSNQENVERFNAFPYELFATYLAVRDQVPVEISNAIQEAIDHSCRNVPQLSGKTLVGIDVSGSMTHHSITGRNGKPSAIRVAHCASLIACALLRHNKSAKLLGFDTRIHQQVALNPHDSIVSNIGRLRCPGGGTNVSLPIGWLNGPGRKSDYQNVIILSDNESWCGSGWHRNPNATETCSEWIQYAANNPKAKLACVDLQPGTTTQVPNEPKRVANIGGWNDAMFKVMGQFFGRNPDIDFVSLVESMEI